MLLFNAHISDSVALPIEFPDSEDGLPDKFAKLLFRMSSPLPPRLLEAAKAEGFGVPAAQRGFVFNADLVSVIRFLDIGTACRPGVALTMATQVAAERWQAFHTGKAGNTADGVRGRLSPAIRHGPLRRRRRRLGSVVRRHVGSACWSRGSSAEPGKPWRDSTGSRRCGHLGREGRCACRCPGTPRRSGTWAPSPRSRPGLASERAGRPAAAGGPWPSAIAACFTPAASRLLRSFPMHRSADFGNRPSCSVRAPAPDCVQCMNVERAMWTLAAGDRFFLMTDALAQWFLLRPRARAKIRSAEFGDSSRRSRTAAAFAAWVDERRAGAVMRNDDVTLDGRRATACESEIPLA